MGRKSLSFSHNLFLSVITVYCIFVATFLYYQYHREKVHKVELLNTTLMMFNTILYDNMSEDFSNVGEQIELYQSRHHLKNLRVTVIDREGKVLYDNDAPADSIKENHLINREEILKAKSEGNGFAIKRTSETLGESFFYSATYFPDRHVFVRSALPYDTNLIAMLNADKGYLWFTFLLSAILLLVFYNFTARLGAMITQLRIFAQRADRDETIDKSELKEFKSNDLGQISRHIIDIYTRLHKTKDDLFLEREKLISHLQISNEGLAIFNPGKDIILTNGLFMQYINLISDRNISATNEIFKVKELEPLFDFIQLAGEVYTRGDLRQKMLKVDKNGYIFILSVSLFADMSFEISISDITKQEEQARMKQQITQNISHELKTPVSSIQGYLETILNNPDLPPETLRLFLERSFAQSNRLTSLLQDISTLNRMTEAGHLVEVENVELSSLIHSVISDLTLSLEKKDMTVMVNIPEKMTIEGNSSLLYSIFRNLTDNAIAYAGTGVQIKLICYAEDEECYYFSFCDNGVGIASEHLGRIFERFYRVDKGRSRKLGGTGLGLAIVKNAVLFHGGTINARPAFGGQGLEFLFTLKKHKS